MDRDKMMEYDNHLDTLENVIHSKTDPDANIHALKKRH